MTCLNESLEYLEFQNQIDWRYFSPRAKMQELIKRDDISRAYVAALAQGIIYLAGECGSNGESTSSFSTIASSRNRPYRVRIGTVSSVADSAA